MSYMPVASPLDTVEGWAAAFSGAMAASSVNVNGATCVGAACTVPFCAEHASPARTPRAEKQHRMRVEATARHNVMAHATIMAREADRAERLDAGVTGREGYVAWTFARMEAIRDALDGSLVTLTLRRFKATKKTWRVVATGVANVGTEVIRLRGEASVRDIANASTLDGATVTVRLTRAETRKGEKTTRFNGTSEGVSSTGQRIGVKVTLFAGRHERVIASAF